MKALILIVSLSVFCFTLACDVDSELVQLTIDIAKQEGVQPELLIAVVWAESRFCPDAVSHAGAIGLGQLMPRTAEELKVNPYSNSENLLGAVSYLKKQYLRFGNWQLALAAYNAGPSRVQNENGIPKIDETINYVKRVLRIYSQLVHFNKPI